MTDILTEIIANKRFEIDFQKRQISSEQLQDSLTDTSVRQSFKAALLASNTGIIAECKRKSPSKGWIHQFADMVQIAKSYQAAGATAISVLTDERFFGGSLRDLRMVHREVDIPILRKDFIIDEYQLYQAKTVGADAVLLIAACLSAMQCADLTGRAHELGLEVLLEIHDEGELVYITPETDVVGVNNRHLGSFLTHVDTSFRLALQLPKDHVRISESGISQPETVRELRQSGYRGFLIGENFMKTDDPGQALDTFIRQIV